MRGRNFSVLYFLQSFYLCLSVTPPPCQGAGTGRVRPKTGDVCDLPGAHSHRRNDTVTTCRVSRDPDPGGPTPRGVGSPGGSRVPLVPDLSDSGCTRKWSPYRRDIHPKVYSGEICTRTSVSYDRRLRRVTRPKYLRGSSTRTPGSQGERLTSPVLNRWDGPGTWVSRRHFLSPTPTLGSHVECPRVLSPCASMTTLLVNKYPQG